MTGLIGDKIKKDQGNEPTTQLIIVLYGNAERNGSSLPTPFCSITNVVSKLATERKSSGFSPGLIALWAHIM
jgi:hypothetical protein